MPHLAYYEELAKQIDENLPIMEDEELAYCLEAILPLLPEGCVVSTETGVEVNIPDLIRKLVNSVIRERHDAAMFSSFLSETYYEVTCGRVSKPTTLPSEVASVWQELEREHIAEAVAEVEESHSN